MLKKDINSPLTSSAGRLFDAVSSLLGLVDFNTFEGEAAIALEAIAEETNKHTIESYPFRIIAKEPMQIDLKPLIESLVEDSIHGLKTSAISLKFHVTLASIIRDVANIMRRENEINTVVLSGGVFQNRLLLQFAIKFLEHERFTVRFHKRIPTNDGGISLGQAVIAWEKLKNDMPCVSEYPEK
jgi:hydrogenase maturation protein HypF